MNIPLLSDKIKAIHIKDFVMGKNDRAVTMLGEGLMEIEHLFSRMQELPTMPELILDELPLKDYKKAILNLEERLH